MVARRGGESVLGIISGAWNDAINMNRQAPLPVRLAEEPVWVEVYVADDVAAAGEAVQRLQLRLLISGDPDPRRVGVKFNGVELRDPQVAAAPPPAREARIDGQGNWWTYGLTPRQMATGRNLLTLLTAPTDGTERATLLEKVEVHVTYRSKSCQHSRQV